MQNRPGNATTLHQRMADRIAQEILQNSQGQRNVKILLKQVNTIKVIVNSLIMKLRLLILIVDIDCPRGNTVLYLKP